MAEINLGNPQEEVAQGMESPEYEMPTDAEENFTTLPPMGEGMSEAELLDPNKIKVEIADHKTPLVVFFGPPSCGKTMTLIRLTRYLRGQGYTVEPITSFRPSYDTNYKEMCAEFDQMIGSEDAARSTTKINFMLVQVSFQGKPLCQILEAPGEHYFSPNTPKTKFPKYINAIINCNNRKIWAIMVEPDKTNASMGTEARRAYANKISDLKVKMRARDKVIFVFNKIDESQFVIDPENIKYGYAKRYIENLYPNIFSKFVNTNPITRWWHPCNFDFVAFQTGDFSETADGTLSFEQGADIYPKQMWKIICKRLKG